MGLCMSKKQYYTTNDDGNEYLLFADTNDRIYADDKELIQANYNRTYNRLCNDNGENVPDDDTYDNFNISKNAYCNTCNYMSRNYMPRQPY